MREGTLRTRRIGTAVASLKAVLGIGLLGATPARAENDFANGFEDQLGRLVAFEAFQLGRFVLGSAFAVPAAHYGYGSYEYAPPRRVREHRAPRDAYRPHECDEPWRHQRDRYRDWDDPYDD